MKEEKKLHPMEKWANEWSLWFMNTKPGYKFDQNEWANIWMAEGIREALRVVRSGEMEKFKRGKREGRNKT